MRGEVPHTAQRNCAKIPGLLRYLGFLKQDSVTSSFNGGGGSTPSILHFTIIKHAFNLFPLTEQN
jgi:hypothetical protein